MARIAALGCLSIALADEYIRGHNYKRLTANRLIAGASDGRRVEFQDAKSID